MRISDWSSDVCSSDLDFLADPTRLDVLHQQRAGAVLAVREAVVEHGHDGQAGVEADEVGQLQRAHRMIGAEPHGGIDGDRTSVVWGKRVSVSVDLGGRSIIKHTTVTYK